ncbi:MAG: hypothetical protein ACLQG3_00360 [Terracidiphilus sp.]
MQKACSLVRCLSPLCLSLLLPLLLAGAARGQSARTEIDYTGSLLGYYRMEFGEPDGKHLPPVQAFLDFRKQDPSRLLLGMGDNFGPEFGASLQLENDPGKGHPNGCFLPQNKSDNGETRPESLYKNDDRVAGQARCDNVLNFLMHAGFRAVVPGSQDFMYTARWLRVAGLLLADADRDPAQSAEIENSDHAVALLSANLRIAMKRGGQGGGARCPLLFSQDPLGRGTFRCVGDGTVPEPLDWLDRLDRLSRNSGANSTVAALQELVSTSALQNQGREAVLSTLVGDEISIMQSAWGQRFHVPSLAPGDRSKNAPAGSAVLTSKQAADFADALDRMSDCPAPAKTGDQAEMCAYAGRLSQILRSFGTILAAAPGTPGPASAQPGPASFRQIGASLMLTDEARLDAIDGLLRTIAMEEENIGYAVAHTGDGSKVLIVGVTGQETLNAVSHTNLYMCPGKPDSPKEAFGSCGERSKAEANGGGATVVAAEPVQVSEAIVRGAELLAADRNEAPFDRVVVMAQMPHTEAEVLAERVWKRLSLDSPGGKLHPVDVVFGEAEAGYSTPQQTLTFPASALGSHSAPVVTPTPSYSPDDGSYPGQVSRLAFVSSPDGSLSLTNQPDGLFTLPSVKGSSQTTIAWLAQLVAELEHTPPPTNAGADTASRQKAEFALLNDLRKSSHPRADVVLLQSRDVELDALGPAYSGYEMCDGETDRYDLCRLRAALDRIFWKGDYLEYVAVTGKSLKDILARSEEKMAEQAQLADTGLTQEWLISFGIVQSALSNVTDINQNNEPLWIPVDPLCKSDTPGRTTYCIAGTPIGDDAYYWLLTSDHLAEDKVVYGTLEGLPSSNHVKTETYVTAPLSHYLLDTVHGSSAPTVALGPPTGSVQKTINAENENFQQAPLWQIDFAKVVASFTSRQPVGGNQFVGSYFQGVSDARASAPASQELDLELANRITGSFFGPAGSGKSFAPLSIGEQTAFAYDRAVIGNLSPATKAINASYSLNNLTEGAFLQLRLGGGKGIDSVRSVHSLPRWLLVFTPHQYQIEINNPYLFFPFATSAVPAGELKVRLPRISGWTDRAGFRGEFGQNNPKYIFQGGSYFETGMEFSTQNATLAALTLQTGSKQKTCTVSAYITLQTCFSSASYGTPASALTINSTTTVVGSPAVKTLHTPGVYWTLHFQNRLWGGAKGAGEGGPPRQLSLVTDSQGDYYFGRAPTAELPTQTEYAIPLSVALVLPSLGNLSFAPTYSGFFYQSQLTSNSLQVNSFSIVARWYFARDARVPLRRQIPLAGPPSADQTKTGKGH